MSKVADPHGPEANGPLSSRGTLLEKLFRSEAPSLARYIRSRIGRADDVQDLVQDAFARLAAARPSILEERPEAYLQRVARNLVVDRHNHSIARAASQHVPFDEALSMAMPPEQEWAIEAKDAADRYLAVLDALPDQTRQIFLLNRVDGLTYAQIAQRLGISGKTVEYHIGRALAQLHRTFYGQ